MSIYSWLFKGAKGKAPAVEMIKSAELSMTDLSSTAQILSVRRVREGAIIPTRGSALSSGLDLYAICPDGPVDLAPMQRSRIPTGLKIKFPAGFEGQVRPRSGLAANYGVTVLNAPGTIDQDFPGELEVILVNLGEKTFRVLPGMRIAQLVICPVELTRVVEVLEDEDPAPTAGRAGGFGSTGL
jgi:dUTP pyrophosphatase